MHSTMQSSSASSRSRTTSCSSTPSQPIQFGFAPSSRADTHYDASSYSSNASNFSTDSTSSTCSSASASPYGSSCLQRRVPTSYLSDAELFGGDQAPFLDEAPAPPRGAEAWLEQARAQGHAPPMTNHRPLPIPIQSSSPKSNGRAASSFMPSSIDYFVDY